MFIQTSFLLNAWEFDMFNCVEIPNYKYTIKYYPVSLSPCYGSLSSIDHSLGIVISVTHTMWIDNITCLIIVDEITNY